MAQVTTAGKDLICMTIVALGIIISTISFAEMIGQFVK